MFAEWLVGDFVMFQLRLVWLRNEANGKLRVFEGRFGPRQSTLMGSAGMVCLGYLCG
jgi:hypothetical protein